MALNFLNDGYFAGKVGIGIASPSATLHLSGISQTGTKTAFRIDNDSGNNKFFVNSVSGDYNLQFKNAGNITRVLLNSNGDSYLAGGKVGIGTASPTSKLDIRQSTSGGSDVLGTGSITIGSDNPYWTLRGTATSLQDLAFDRNYSGTWYESMRIQRNSGNVGINDTSGYGKLAIKTGGTFTFDSNDNDFSGVNILMKTTNAALNAVGSGMVWLKGNNNNRKVAAITNYTYGDVDQSGLNFYVQPNAAGSIGVLNEAMRITNAGGISFGTTGTAYGTSGQILKSNGNASPTWIDGSAIPGVPGGSGTVNTIPLWTPDGDTLGNSVMFQSSNNISIGITTPNAKLSVQNDISIGTSATDVLRLYNNSGVGAIDGYSTRNLAFGSATNGEVMRIDNTNGRVGIGVTSPLSKLTIDAPVGNFANGTNAISLNYDGGSSPDDVGGGIVFSQKWWSGSAGLQVTGGIYGIKNAGDGTYGGGLAFYTQPSSAAAMAQRMIIDTDGNVGIGTTSPGYKLQVNDGNVAITGGTTSTLFMNITTNQLYGDVNGVVILKANNNLRLNTNGAERMRIIDNGNVGIGTTSPIGKLNIQQSTLDIPFLFSGRHNSENEPILQMGESTEFSGSSSYGELLIHSYNRDIVFSTQAQATFSNVDGSALIIEKGNGNVGIGTTGPGYKLDVAGQGFFASGIITNTAVAVKLKQAAGTLNDATEFRVGGGEFKIYSGRDSGSHQAFVFATGDNYTSGSERMRITSDGNVGIGTSSPTAKLDVAGTGNFTGLVSGITPVNAANFVTKAYVDGSGGGTGPFLPLAGGTLSGPGNLTVGGTTNLSSTLTVVGVTTLANVGYLGDGLGSVQYTLQSANNGFGTIDFGDVADANIGRLSYSHVDDSFLIRTNNATALTLDSSQNATFAGDITTNGDIIIDNSSGNPFLKLKTSAQEYVLRISQSNSEKFQIRNTTSSVTALSIDTSSNATFVGDVTAARFILPSTGTTTPVNRYLYTDNTNTGTGRLIIQSGAGSAAYGGAINLFSNSHASKPGWVTAGISSGSGGKFTVNSQGLAGGTDVFTVDTLGNATFAGDVTLNGEIYGRTSAAFPGLGGLGFYSLVPYLENANQGGLKIQVQQGNSLVDALTLDFSKNATFTGKITSGNDIVNATAGVYTWVNDTDTYIQRSAGNEITFKTGASTALVLNSSQNATFSAKAYGVAPITSDPDSTIATKGYVNSLITGATIYRGTWDPDVSLNSGYGNPNLNTVTQTSGYYYICSADGTATPNGATTEPNTWNTGDWVIWNDDIGASGEWQKIDNSSVLSGVGTGQTVALWEGAGSVTDSETLGNAPITVSGNNTTFAGNVIVNGAQDALTINTTDTDGPYAVWKNTTNATLGFVGNANSLASAGNTNFAVRAQNDLIFASGGGTERMRIDSFGNVGIGTVSPVTNLTVVKSGVMPTSGFSATQWVGAFVNTGAVDRIARVGIYSGNNSFSLLNFGDVDDADIGGISYSNIDNSMALRTNNGERLLISSAGAIKFNNYNATNNTGTPTYLLGTDASGNIVKTLSSSAPGSLWAASGNNIYNTNSANVGIGTTGPVNKIQANYSPVAIASLTANTGTASTNWNRNAFLMGTGASASNALAFGVSGTANDRKAWIQSGHPDTAASSLGIISLNPLGGNVGIGTTSPTRKLHVNGDIQVDTNLVVNSGIYNTTYYAGSSTATYFKNSVASDTLTILESGNVGIGTTSPATKLQVNGGVLLGSTYTLPTGSSFTTANSQLILGGAHNSEFNTSGVKLLISGYNNDGGVAVYPIFAQDENGNDDFWIRNRLIDTALPRAYFAGDVGIGTTTPQSKLQVAGGIQMADDTDTASAAKVGTMRYRTGTEYVEVDGVELVTNGDFTSTAAWNLNSNWAISGGTCNADGTSNADINQNTVLGVVGQKYRITYVISAYTQGSISARIGSGVTAYNTGTGTFTQVVTATTTDRIRMNIASSFIGSVDSLSIVKVTAEDASYADMCMQTGASTYEWVNIVRNTY